MRQRGGEAARRAPRARRRARPRSCRCRAAAAGSRVRRPRIASRARWTAPVLSALIGTPSNTRGVGLAQADAPVAAVERRRRTRRRRATTASRPAVEQRGRDLRRVHADEERRAAGVLERGREPLGEAVAALGHDLEAVGHPVAGLAVEHEHAAAVALDGAARRRACPRARRAASAAACSGVQGGVRRVFTRPGTGSLAITRRAGAMMCMRARRASGSPQARRPCRAPRGRCRAPSR